MTTDIEIADRLRENAKRNTAMFQARPSRLEKAARTLLAKAEASLGANRLTNTRKRAEQAAQASRRAERDILRAKVALAIVANGGMLGPARVAALSEVQEYEIALSKVVSKVFGWVPDEKRTHEQDAEAVEKWAVGLSQGVLRALVALRASCDTVREDPVRALERGLVNFTAPGFFPTPRTLAARMVEIASDALGRRSLDGLTMLEPSAGSGRLADAARDAGAKVKCVEVNHTLAELLVAKGHDVVHADFLDTVLVGRQSLVDVVLANFPFENGADAVHAQHAFKHLRPGSVMVCITGEGIWSRSDRIALAFRTWIVSLGDALVHDERLPSGTFNAPDVTQRTMVASRLIAIRKAAP